MKNLLLTTITALATYTTQAQFQLGLLTDYHYSYLYNKSDVAADARLDYVATYKPAFGAVLGYQISNRFGVQISPQYFGAGQQFTGVLISSPRSVKYDIRLHYLQLPIQLNIHLHSPDSKLTSTILLGGYIGGLLSYTETRYHSQYTPNINNKLSSDINTYSNLSGTVQATFLANNQDSVVTLQGTFTKPLFNKMDVGAMLGYQMGYQISKQMSVNLNANIKYGFSQIDNLDTIGSYLNSTPNIIKNYTKKQELYCRNGRGGNAVDGLRDPKSNNIFVGLQLSFIYTFSSKITN